MTQRGYGPADELRKLLIVDQRKQSGPGSRWYRPGARNESLDALESGEPVIVSSGEIFSALSRAGLPHDDFVYGGKYFRGEFLLDADGSITEYVEEVDPDAPHCGGTRKDGTPNRCFRCDPKRTGRATLTRAQVG